MSTVDRTTTHFDVTHCETGAPIKEPMDIANLRDYLNSLIQAAFTHSCPDLFLPPIQDATVDSAAAYEAFDLTQAEWQALPKHADPANFTGEELDQVTADTGWYSLKYKQFAEHQKKQTAAKAWMLAAAPTELRDAFANIHGPGRMYQVTLYEMVTVTLQRLEEAIPEEILMVKELIDTPYNVAEETFETFLNRLKRIRLRLANLGENPSDMQMVAKVYESCRHLHLESLQTQRVTWLGQTPVRNRTFDNCVKAILDWERAMKSAGSPVFSGTTTAATAGYSQALAVTSSNIDPLVKQLQKCTATSTIQSEHLARLVGNAVKTIDWMKANPTKTLPVGKKFCVLHGDNNTHTSDQCKGL